MRRDLAISIRHISKSYNVALNAAKHSTLAEALLDKARRPFKRDDAETFWALRDVSFDIRTGDVVGIIGRNGAGKSTLLKILSRITEPTKGAVDMFGRVGSLLEVGTGFHPELTGRENIFLNGTILGMSRRDVARQFDAIVDFAGVEKFLETPVKRYSSGMYVRLAFAVAAHLDPDILLIDEVLAVGDQEFQQKCLGKMKDVATTGRTVLFVSHNMQAVSTLCTRAVYLRAGQVAYEGNVRNTVQEYLDSIETSGDADESPDRRPGTGEYRFTSVAPVRNVFTSDGEKEIRFRIERRRGSRIGKPLHLSAHVVNSLGVVVAQLDSRLVGHLFDEADAIEGSVKFSTPWLKPGGYRIDMYICAANYGVVDSFEPACGLHVSPVLPYRHAISKDGQEHGVVFGDFEWHTAPAAKPAPAAAPAPAAPNGDHAARKLIPTPGTAGKG